MLDFSRALTPLSACRYLAWKLRRRDPIRLQLRNGISFWLRPGQAENNDYGVAYEVFVHDLYQVTDQLDPSSARLVVDLGGNVGFSVLHWLRSLPAARVEVYEPHPAHVAQLRRNLQLSGQEARVVVHAAAAGASTRGVLLSDATSSSSVLGSGPGRLEVPMEDVLARFEGRRIDLLKMDIEGGEYELLGDPRFAGLDVGVLVMEWHSRGGGELDRAWCEGRLVEAGYRLRTVFTQPDHGMLWAMRDGAPAAPG